MFVSEKEQGCTDSRDVGLEDRPRSRGRPRDLILMASVSVLVSAAHVSVLVSEVPVLSTGSREPASVSRPASRPNLDGLGLGLGLGHPCLGLGLGLGGPGLDYNPDVDIFLFLFFIISCLFGLSSCFPFHICKILHRFLVLNFLFPCFLVLTLNFSMPSSIHTIFYSAAILL